MRVKLSFWQLKKSACKAQCHFIFLFKFTTLQPLFRDKGTWNPSQFISSTLRKENLEIEYLNLNLSEGGKATSTTQFSNLILSFCVITAPHKTSCPPPKSPPE